MKFHLFSFFLLPVLLLQAETSILCIGDSITEGGKSFSVYRYPLYQMLKGKGYKFVGSKSSHHDGVDLPHDGYGGKNTEFLQKNIEKIYRKSPADFVLLHSGHNSFAKDKPINGIIDATEKIIRSIHKINPKAIILVASVIPSGKQPKYSYIPELNQRLKLLCKKAASGKIISVDMETDFNWREDTVSDKVHPNSKGAEKMARKWLEALNEFK